MFDDDEDIVFAIDLEKYSLVNDKAYATRVGVKGQKSENSRVEARSAIFLERDIVGSTNCRQRHFKHVRTVKKGGMQNEPVKLNKWNYFF